MPSRSLSSDGLLPPTRRGRRCVSKMRSSDEMSLVKLALTSHHISVQNPRRTHSMPLHHLRRTIQRTLSRDKSSELRNLLEVATDCDPTEFLTERDFEDDGIQEARPPMIRRLTRAHRDGQQVTPPRARVVWGSPPPPPHSKRKVLHMTGSSVQVLADMFPSM